MNSSHRDDNRQQLATQRHTRQLVTLSTNQLLYYTTISVHRGKTWSPSPSGSRTAAPSCPCPLVSDDGDGSSSDNDSEMVVAFGYEPRNYLGRASQIEVGDPAQVVAAPRLIFSAKKTRGHEKLPSYYSLRPIPVPLSPPFQTSNVFIQHQVVQTVFPLGASLQQERR